MKTVGKSIALSLLITLAITAFLNWESLSATKENVDSIAVAAGDVPIEDPTSPDPQEHCYPVASTDKMDVKMLVDFEARTAKDWVASDDAPEGQLCLVETPKAVEKRLADQDGE